jgi:hypothetical protein
MLHVMATRRALENEEQIRRVIGTGRPVYFLYDMFCDPGFHGVATPPLCPQMVGRFALSPVVEETLEHRSFILYRVSGPATGDVSRLLHMNQFAMR